MKSYHTCKKVGNMLNLFQNGDWIVDKRLNLHQHISLLTKGHLERMRIDETHSLYICL